MEKSGDFWKKTVLQLQRKLKSILTRKNQVVLDGLTMHANVEIAARKRMSVCVMSASVNLVHIVNCVLTAMTDVQILKKKFALLSSSRLMSAMDVHSWINVVLRKQSYDAYDAHLVFSENISESRTGILSEENELLRLNAYKMGFSFTKWESCLQIGTFIYKMGIL